MTNLERKKKEAELANVRAARLNQEYKIEEKLDEIERLKAAIIQQEAREAQLTEELRTQQQGG